MIGKSVEPFTVENFDEIVGQVRHLLGKKGKEYNTSGLNPHDYFPLGKRDYDVILYLKALRQRAQPEGCKNIDTLYDLLNYTIFAIDYLQKVHPDWYAPGIREKGEYEEKRTDEPWIPPVPKGYGATSV